MSASNQSKLTLGRIAATLPVSNIEKSAAAYRRIFGFTKTFENGDPVGFMILKKDDAELHLTLQKNHRPLSFNVAHMLVSDASEALRRCEAEDFRIIKALRQQEYGLKSFVFADLDGNRIDVGEVVD